MSDFFPTCVDVSEHQGDIVWVTVDGKLWMAILRVQDGTYCDTKLSRNIKECERLGIPYYCYGFYRGGGATEAARMVSRYKQAGGTKCLGFIIDTEVSGLSHAGIKSAFKTLVNSGFKKNGHYIANHLWNEYGNDDYGEAWRWVPVYGVNDGKPHTPPKHKCDMWQFTSAGSVPGISGNVDCNAIVSDDKDIKWFVGDVPPQQVEQSHNVGDLDLTAKDYILVGAVLSGKAGNGDDRKKALGSRYDEIQSIVNHVLTAKSLDLAKEVWDGRYGNGEDREKALGPRFDEVQEKVELLAGETETRYYFVKSGDTLSNIAWKLGFGNNWKYLADKNNIRPPYTIYPGQKVYY